MNFRCTCLFRYNGKIIEEHYDAKDEGIMNLKEKVKELPMSPGVYLMKDSQDQIIYVGKAKILKRRVQSYFQNAKAPSQKVEKLKKTINDFEYILTDTEFEAFMLECQLIKELKPFYNKKMKSPLSYTYIMIRMDNGYQRMDISHNLIENANSLYFGPYTSKSTVEKAIKGIKEFYKIDCHSSSKRNTACLNYSLGLCIGTCLGGAKVEQYNHIMNKIVSLFHGTDLSVLEEINNKMSTASEKFDFETAARYRNYIEAIKVLLNKEKVIAFTEENRNIVILEPLTADSFKLFLVKRNQVLFSRIYSHKDKELLEEKIKKDILSYFKASTNYLKISKDEIDEAQIIYSYLKGSTCSYSFIPEKWLTPKNLTHLENTLKKLLYC
jgi:excinuclease ABC subunit C